MIKTIIFDYAGVITPTRNKSLFAQQNHRRFNRTPSELMDILYRNWHAASINKISDKQYWKLLGNDLNIDEEELKTMVIASFPIDMRLINLLDEIKDRYTLIMMSNQIEDWLESVIKNNRLRNKFDYFINSYQVGLKKPNKDIFKLALKKSQSEPAKTLFIDDSEENTKAARELGIKTIKFENFKQFFIELQQYITVSD